MSKTASESKIYLVSFADEPSVGRSIVARWPSQAAIDFVRIAWDYAQLGPNDFPLEVLVDGCRFSVDFEPRFGVAEVKR